MDRAAKETNGLAEDAEHQNNIAGLKISIDRTECYSSYIDIIEVIVRRYRNFPRLL